MSLSIGESVGAYRIVEQLGQGGMATVFKAYHASLDRYVAIKVLHPAFKEDPTFLARFQREARVVAKLEHINIVPVYDFAEHNGAPYLVMKFIEGETLKARLARAPLTVEETLRVIEAMGAGLDYAHRQGILHRDIKPSNVMLARDGGIYIADFGLARIALAGESTLSTDAMLGTPHYMSPEQAKGVKELDAGTDIYSLGVVLYELTVGRVPYSADTPFAIIHDHIYTPLPPPRAANPNVPESIERVLLKALAKERTDRYADVADMVTAYKRATIPFVAQLLDRDQTPNIALPRSTRPIAPTDQTPPAETRTQAAAVASTVARPRPPDTTPLPVVPQPQVSSTAPLPVVPQKSGGYKFEWWHGLMGAGVVMLGVMVTLLAVNALRPKPAPPTQVVAPTAVAPTVIPPTRFVPTPRINPTPVPPTPGGPGTPLPPPTPVDNANPTKMLEEAESAFKAGDTSLGQSRLELAVVTSANDPNTLLRAGDIALTNHLALYALERFYLPAMPLTQPQDPLGLEVRAHAALAFYVGAADPAAGPFLEAQRQLNPEGDMVALALARHKIFSGDLLAASSDLKTLDAQQPGSPAVALIAGDWYLAQGQLPEAQKKYEQVSDSKPGQGGPPAPPWMHREADCNLRRMHDQGQNFKLEQTCEDLSLLVTGR